jgi:hypothetical protein
MMEKATARRDSAQKTLDALSERRKKILENADTATFAGQMELARRINENPTPGDRVASHQPVAEAKRLSTSETPERLPRPQIVPETPITVDKPAPKPVETPKPKIPGMSFVDAENLTDLRKIPEDKHTNASRAMLKELEKKEAKAKDVQERIEVLKGLPDTPERRKQIAEMEAKVEPEPAVSEKEVVTPTQPIKDPINEQILRKQLEALPQHTSTPGHTEAILDIIKARAKALGEDVDAFIGRRFSGIEYHNKEKFDKAGNVIGGEIDKSAADGRRLIRVFKSGDASTVLHETFHQFREDLVGRDLEVAAKECKATLGDDGVYRWSRAAEEKFVALSLRWFREGRAPSPELATVFQKFSAWIKNVYDSVLKGPLKGRPSKAMEEVLNRMLTKAETRSVEAKTSDGPDVLNASAKKPDYSRVIPDADLARVSRGDKGYAESQARTANRQQPGDRMYPREAQAADMKKFRDDPEGMSDHLDRTKNWGHAEFAMSRQRILSTRVGSARFLKAVIEDMNQRSKIGSILQNMYDRNMTPKERAADIERRLRVVSMKRTTFRKALGLDTQIDILRQTVKQMDPATAEAKQMEKDINKLQEKLDKLARENADRYERMLDRVLKDTGIDLRSPDLEALVSNSRETDKMFATIRNYDRDWVEKYGEINMSILHLSGGVAFKKLFADVGGTAHYVTLKQMEGVVGTGQRMLHLGGKEAPGVGEAISALALFKQNLAEAHRLGAESFKTGWEPAHLESAHAMVHAPTPGTPAKIMRHTSLISTMQYLTTLTKTVIGKTEAELQARREAKQKGLTENAAKEYVAEQMADFDSPAWVEGKRQANQYTLTNAAPGARIIASLKYGKVNGNVFKLIAKMILHAELPFYNIPMNAEYRIARDWIPVLSEGLAIAERFAQTHEKATVKDVRSFDRFMTTEVAQGVLRYGTLMGAGMTGFASGFLTGPDDEINPSSFNLFGKHVPWRFFGPAVAGPMDALAWFFSSDSAKIQHIAKNKGTYSAKEEKALEGLKELGGQTPVGGFIRNMENWWTDKAFAVANKLPNPSLVGQIVRATDDELTRSLADKKMSFLDRFKIYAKEKYAGRSGEVILKNGVQLEKEAFENPALTMMYRITMGGLGVQHGALSVSEPALDLFNHYAMLSDKENMPKFPVLKNADKVSPEEYKKRLESFTAAEREYSAGIASKMDLLGNDDPVIAKETWDRWKKGADVLKDATDAAHSDKPLEKEYGEILLKIGPKILQSEFALTTAEKASKLKTLESTIKKKELKGDNAEKEKTLRLAIQRESTKDAGSSEYLMLKKAVSLFDNAQSEDRQRMAIEVLKSL